MRRLLALLLLLPLPAHALDACYPDVTGLWIDWVRNEGELQELTTEFTLAPDGRPEGRYHVEADLAFEGTLTDFRETGPCEGDFTWTDRYGSGVVHIVFTPARGRFLGNWGLDRPEPGNIFNGHRRRVPATS